MATPKTTAKGYAFAIGLPATPAEPPPWHETSNDHVVALMLAEGVPVTQENWIDLAYGREIPDPWTAEDEAGLPDELQDWSKVLLMD